MNFKFPLLCASLSIALLFPSMNSQACFTVIVGKDVSANGNIMVGHNEDNGGRIMSNQYWVPPATHAAGEMIEYEPTAAKIPQAEKTNGFWWEQTLHPDGYSFSDSFFNDKGVVVNSNNCGATIEQDEKEVLKDGGIGYGIRRLIAERATSARDGVTIAIDLVTKYGYRHPGRTYTIADRNEAWQLALLMGGRYLARRVGNDEMTVMSNAFSLGYVNLKDKNNVIASPDLVENAIKKGTYKPAREGDYSDFNFRKAYNLEERLELDTNVKRVREAILHLTGIDYDKPYDHSEAMLIKPKHKISVADIRDILRLNSPWDRRESGWHHEKNIDISGPGTFDSAVYVMTKNPLLSYTWRTSGRPDSQFSYPQFMLGKPANTQSYLTSEDALMAQFKSVPEQFDYNPNRSVFTFINFQNFLDWNEHAFRTFPITQRAFEADAARDFRVAMIRARELAPLDTEKTIEAMHAFNVQSFDRVLGATSA
ncbi:MAG: C69 family dipeptidase [Burkholderiales bacterium]|nr:C69 family dipeptidase [Burkholderiales bacterium]